jgi:acyl-CoA reductase-like NAD-dependent aldehyde dehydrogenase
LSIPCDKLEQTTIPNVNLFIDGHSTPAAAGGYFDRLDPSTNLVASRAACGRREDAEQMASIAAARFSMWSSTDINERVKILRRAKKHLPNYRDRFAQLMLSEIGAINEWVDFNIRVAADAIEAAVELALRYAQKNSISKTQTSYIVRQPVGVCLAIAPWNAPIVLAMRAVVFPLAFGNCVILKASELSPATHSLIADVLHEAGLPSGVLGVMTNAPEHSEEVIASLIAHPSVRRVNFTGSTRIGKIIAGMAAQHLKRCLLELGGKSPFIVLKDANLQLAAQEAVYGAFLNQGQICMATDRIIVEQPVADAFISIIKGLIENLIAGDPRRDGVKLGPVASPSIASRLSSLIEDAVDKGATLITGTSRRGQFIDATLLDNITPMMRIYSEECFGPIAGIYRVESAEEAITVANNCEYGLAAAIFTQDLTLAKKVANRLESGMCHINSATLKDDPTMPFGGLKSSGYGRFGGDACVDEFTEVRWITIEDN